MKYLFYLIIFSVLFNCNSNDQNEIKNIQIKLANLENSFSNLTPNKVSIAFSGYKENIELVRSCVDTLESSFAIRMNIYKGLKKTCPKFLNIFTLTKKNLESQILQIQSLKKDIDNDLIPIDSLNIYFSLEEKNTQKISDNVLELTELYDFINSVNDSLYEPIKIYAETLCSKKEI
jgi:archaellum component FlaC